MFASPVSRRTALIGLAATFAAGPALAGGQARAVQEHPGFSAWRPAASNLPLRRKVITPSGEMTLKAWLGGQPAVVILWASWCAPCMDDKPFQAAMQRRLEAAHSRTRMVLLQCFDEEADEAVVAWRLKRLGAGDLVSVKATAALEADLLRWFGPGDPGMDRPTLPSLALIGGDGTTLGRCEGRPFTPDDYEWWPQGSAFDLLTSLK